MKNTQKNTTDTLPRDQLLVLTCTSNSKYISPLCVFLSSLHTHNQIPVVCRLVNCSDDEVKKISEFPNTTVLIDNQKLSVERNIRNSSELLVKDYKQLRRKSDQSGFKGVGWLYSQEASYCSNIKYNTINQLLSANNNCVVYMDVDTIIRDDVSSIYQHVIDHDAGMFICEEEKNKDSTVYGDKYMGWHAGIIIANNTSLSERFFSVVEKRVSDDIFNMEADEDEFDYTYKLKEFNQMKIKSINKTYKDNGPKFDSDSLVWSGQAENKESNKQYIAEYITYETQS